MISNEKNCQIMLSFLCVQEFKDLFPNEIPSGLPPKRGIEYFIDLNFKAYFSNIPTHESSSQQTQKS